MGFGGMSGAMGPQVAQGEHSQQASAQQLDAAFEQAFAQIDQDLAEAATTETHTAKVQERADSKDLRGEQYAALMEVVEASEAAMEAVGKVEMQAYRTEKAYRLYQGRALDNDQLERAREWQGDPLKIPEALLPALQLVQYTQRRELLRNIWKQRPGKIYPATCPLRLTMFQALFALYSLREAVEVDVTDATFVYLEALERMEERGILLAGQHEAQTIVRELQDMPNRGYYPEAVRARTERLVQAINERCMSTYPLFSSRSTTLSADALLEELQEAVRVQDIIKDRIARRDNVPRQHPTMTEMPQADQTVPVDQDQKEAPSFQHDDDEMATTAGQLLERVADNTSEKFQNSQFLELMRKLRDREVKVEGDKMVEVSAQPPRSQQAPPPPSSVAQRPQDPSAYSAIPPIDPTILNHADTDFAMPVFSADADEYATPARHSPASSSPEPLTDEISGQFSHYNVHATYHK